MLNQLINVFWTLVSFSVTGHYWGQYFAERRSLWLVYVFIVISVFAYNIPAKWLSFFTLSTNTRTYELVGIRVMRWFVQDGMLVSRIQRMSGKKHKVIINSQSIIRQPIQDQHIRATISAEIWSLLYKPIVGMNKINLSKSGPSVFLMAVLLFTTNCKSDDPVREVDTVCGVADPINNLKWLNDEFRLFVGGPEINGIVLFEYNGNQVIEVQNSLFSSTNIHQHLCNGAKLDLQSPQALSDYRARRKEVKVLYGTKMWQ
ncbi:hypothetical protein LZD49_17505 [Dyadobacter sp. CY261]|uniref:hypothetical protein n=1 Tax=Dyadobacter sp. CY261 TaxID=2907203 RepID=UPI001F184A56|nr:hypothetical protein [Dyadobacter sp. CY261]MCF0072281.1 hypothetical protein [Dyadobacter sp. CY261]